MSSLAGTAPPARARSASSAPSAEWADPSDDDLANVLIVDDLPEKLLVFGTVLEELGQNLVFVRSGRDALREVLQRQFAVILLDVNMPELDGFETAELIRGYQKAAHTPIIFITSYADEMQTARGYALGAVDYILSPVVPEVLRSKVRAFVSMHAMRRQIRRQAEERAALLAAEAARHVAQRNDERSAFLADASRRLGSSLELTAAVHCLATLVVPRLAALTVVALADDDGTLADDAVLAARKATARGDGAAPGPLPLPLPTPVRLADLAAPLQQALRDAAAARSARQVAPAALEPLTPAAFGLGAERGPPLAARAVVAVPLLAGQRLLGALLAVEIGPIDQALLDDLADRAAIAFENARLYRSLQAEIVERRAAEAELQQANRRKDQFLAMLSHELRNPLAAIHYALDVVRRVADPQSRVTSAAGVMQRQLAQITRLVDELLDLARISQDKIVLHPEALDLRVVIAQSVEAAQPFVGQRGQQLALALPDEPVPLRGDGARLTQVVCNLLHNASKFSPKGASIELRCSVADNAAQVCVRDHGIGIDADLLPRIFDLFEQGERGLDRAQGGLGMGLTLALRLARLHGGTIEAFSEGRDRGAEFRLRLPLQAALDDATPPEQGASTAAASPAAPAAAASSRRVLVVDDNLDAARSVVELLELQGHEVATAADGEQALSRAAEFEPEVVILDIGLPLLDGYEVAKRLRASACRALLVAVTGYGQARDRDAAQAAGFDHHFVKPADPVALAACVAGYGRTPAPAPTTPRPER